MMADEEKPGFIGHRGRLRERLLKGGPDALQDYEVIEYLLFLTIPRRDTKPLAKKLLDRFGGIGGLLAADPQDIRKEGKLSEAQVAAIKIAQAAAIHILRAQVAKRPVLGSWQALIDYLRADMAHIQFERVRVLFLNSKNELIGDLIVSDGSVDEAAVYVRNVVDAALKHKATALILVHNHPSGDPQPSQQDIRLTREIVDATRHLRISVHDHVIVGSKGHASMRAMGLI
jgi:DNA repair protein RadC